MDIHCRIKVGVAVLLVVSSLPGALCYYPQGYAASGSYPQGYALYPTGPDNGMYLQNQMNNGYQSPPVGMRSLDDTVMNSAMAPLNTVVTSVATAPRPIPSALGLLQQQPVQQTQRSASDVHQESKKSNCTSGCSAARSLYPEKDTSVEEETPQPESGVQCHCWTFGLLPMYPPRWPKYPQYPAHPPEYPPQVPQAQFARNSEFFYLPLAQGVRQSYGSQFRPPYPTQFRPAINRPLPSYEYYHPKPQGDFYYNRP